MSETSTESHALKKRWTDYVMATSKGALGAVPFVGPLLAELLGIVLPGLWSDRMAQFATELSQRLTELEEDVIRMKLQDENCGDLMEETLREAARAVSEDRRGYLAALMANGLKSDDVSYIESKHLLQMLGELNDVEVLVLRSYLVPTLGGDEEFRRKHEEVLRPLTAHLGSSQAEVDKAAIQASYKEHLVRLGLLERRYKLDRRTKLPIFDARKGGMKIQGYEITSLGRLLLRQIDLREESTD